MRLPRRPSSPNRLPPPLHEDDDLPLTSLGHDAHFLSRTVRFRGVELDRAMRLYHHSAVVRQQMASWMERHPDHSRAAIALLDNGPAAHVIVTRDGDFVTCLTAHMHLDSIPVLPYGPFCAAMDEADLKQMDQRVMRQQLAELSGGDLMALLIRGPGHLTYETARIIERRPITYMLPVLIMFIDTVIHQDKDRRLLNRILALPRGDKREELRVRVVRDLRETEGVLKQCLYLMSGMEEKESVDVLNQCIFSTQEMTMEAAMVLGLHEGGHAHLLRALRDDRTWSWNHHELVCGLYTHMLRYPDRACEVMRSLRPRLPDNYTEWGPFWAGAQLALEQGDALLSRLIAESRAAIPYRRPEFSEGLPERTAFVMSALHCRGIAEFFPLEAELPAVRERWQAYVKAPMPKEERARQVVRQAPRVGRNDPCPCQSGRKYKQCCIGKPPATGPGEDAAGADGAEAQVEGSA